MNNNINLCLVGCGGFAEFSLNQYKDIKGLNIYSLVDKDEKRLKSFADMFYVKHTFTEIEEALKDNDLDLVVIATPPWLHYEQALASLKSGKHVLVEKPAAMSGEEVQKLTDEAAKRGLSISCNYVMRYNPFYSLLGDFVKSGIFGPVNSFVFRNYATDEPLPVEHWFWDKKQSGGIFIEHGVHFFDVMNSILGYGNSGPSFVFQRPGTGQEDRVTGNVIYPGGVQGTFYHSFTQKSIIERNYMEVAFKNGYLTLYEWIPTCITGEVWVSRDDLEKLQDLIFTKLPQKTDLTIDSVLEKTDEVPLDLPEFEVEADEVLEKEDEEETETYEFPVGPAIRKRHYSGGDGELFNFTFNLRCEEGKMPIYAEAVKRCMEDTVKAIRDENHKPVISPKDIYESVNLAQKCAETATVYEGYPY